MTHGRKVAAIIAASILGLIAVVFIAGIIVVQTNWFRNFVHQKIVTSVEDATGGSVEISSFDFDWRHLRATVRGFVIHGLEPPNSAPLFRANLVQVDLKLIPRNGGLVDISYLLVDTPQGNVIVYPDGRTNIPAPKIPPKSNGKTGLETVVDLAIGRFDLRNGSVSVAARKMNLTLSGADLRAQITYNMATTSYSGEVDASPLVVQSGKNPPLNVDVKLPIKLEKDRVTLTNARLTTPQSQLLLSGSMEHLIAPQTTARLNVNVALDEMMRAFGVKVSLDTTHGPRNLTGDISFIANPQRIQIQALNARLGDSNVEASGTFQDASAAGSVRFTSTVAIGQLGRLFRISAQPEGTLKLAGNASLPANSQYQITANLNGRDIAIRQGAARVTGVTLESAIVADPHRIEASDLRLLVLGGGFQGSGSIQDLARFHLAGNLHNFDIDRVSRAFHPGGYGYDGIISGPVEADGSIQRISTLVAKANLAIAPAAQGIPVSGHLAINYNGRSGALMVDHSHLALPHTNADFTGSLGSEIQVQLTTRNFDDFKPLVSIPVTFARTGAATLTATVTGSLNDPRITGQTSVSDFAVSGRAFSRLGAQFQASKGSATITNASLTRGTLQAQFSAAVGLREWKPENSEPLRLDGTIGNADVRDILALANQHDIPASGMLSADAHIQGTVGSPTGSADLAVVQGTAGGEPFDSLAAQVAMSTTDISLSNFSLVAGASRLDGRANYQHGINDLRHGVVTAHLASNQVQLSQFQTLIKNRPGLRGLANLNGDVAARIEPAPAGTEFELTSVSGSAAIRNLELEGKSYGDLSVNATTSGSAVRYNVASNLAGSTIRVDGQSQLTGTHQTSVNASIANLPVDRMLALAGHPELPVKGTLTASAQLNGTIQNPEGSGTVTITNGSAYTEPFDRLQAAVQYTDVLVDITRFRVTAGPSNIDLTASYHHPANRFDEGRAQFQAKSNDIQLSRIHALTDARPGLAGVVQLTAEGAAALHNDAPISLSALNANLSAHNLSRNGQNLGDLTASAKTSGSDIDFNLDSDLAHSRIRGSGRLSLSAGYPVEAKVDFGDISWSGLSPLLAASPHPFDAVVDGQLSVAGPMTDMGALRGNLQLTKVEAHSAPSAKNKKARVPFELHNTGNILVSLSNSAITIQNFNVTGPYTNLALSGGLSLRGNQSISLKANGNVKLEGLEAFDSEIFSSGAASLNATVSGSVTKPSVNGRLQLQNASFNMLSLPNGISDANGTVNFNGSEAEFQNISGQTGGGKITLAGFVSYAGPELQFRVQATATRVHVDYPESVTTEASARLSLVGKTSSSLLSGNVTIQSIALHSETDVGSILTSAATPPSPDTVQTGLLAGMRFDVRILTSPSIQFRTSLSQNLEGDASLTLRGTPKNPGMLGRFSITSGTVQFFGAAYTVNQATVSFYNPNKVEPVVSADLETTVQGVDVTINVAGSMDRLKLSYRSDPPLEFSQIVSLLASGKTPTTDPVIAAHQPPAPEQNFEQAGLSTVLGQAVANPVSGRLQRLFGVSKLSIDPQIVGNTSNNPQATLTLQQQVTRDITFTYIQDVSQSNPTALRVEWAISPRFSAIAQRDVYGEFALDFVYKKRFH